MRVYLPASSSDIDSLRSSELLSGRIGYSLQEQWVNSQQDQDPEVLDELLLFQAATDSLENFGQVTGRRIVLVVEMPAESIDPATAKVKVDSIDPKQIQAMFCDDLANKKAILAGQDPSDLDLTWFGPTEILEISDFLAN